MAHGLGAHEEWPLVEAVDEEQTPERQPVIIGGHNTQMESEQRRIVAAYLPGEGAIEMGTTLGEHKRIGTRVQRSDHPRLIFKNRVAWVGAGEGAGSREAGRECPAAEQTF